MIEVSGLSKTYHVSKKQPGFWGSVRSLVRREWVSKHALKDVSFSVGEGEIVGLIGANGAGKTTLSKILSGIVHPSSGEATVLGHKPWERHNDFRQQISLIMGQKAQLWWDLPAADCFLLLKEIYQLDAQQFQRTLDELASMLGVTAQLNVQIRRLSLGERMKMELIAALLHQPRVVFLDEPTIGLDLTAQRAVREFLLHYRQEHQPAMLLTSHYMEDIERLCERIVILREGELVYDGTLQRVRETYADRKLLVAHLREASPDFTLPEALSGCENVTISDAELKMEVPRALVSEAAAYVLRELPVHDLNIEEPEIGAVIERIMTDRAPELSP
ncbi:ATP-binding cassette domain-containing protein [Planctomycetota bacterium]|nr:ATP-binding cassette domain-containing protein [Planctomycetota bacterium]